MGKSSLNPRYNVISMRISEKERRHLNTLIELKRKSVSGIMREALEHYVALISSKRVVTRQVTASHAQVHYGDKTRPYV